MSWQLDYGTGRFATPAATDEGPDRGPGDGAARVAAPAQWRVFRAVALLAAAALVVAVGLQVLAQRADHPTSASPVFCRDFRHGWAVVSAAYATAQRLRVEATDDRSSLANAQPGDRSTLDEGAQRARHLAAEAPTAVWRHATIRSEIRSIDVFIASAGRYASGDRSGRAALARTSPEQLHAPTPLAAHVDGLDGLPVGTTLCH